MRIAFLLVFIGVASRFLSLPHGISLTFAVILLAGAYLRWREVILVALGVMMIGDFLQGFHQLIIWTWTGGLFIGVRAMTLKRNRSYPRVAMISMGTSTVYYLWCQLGMWVMGNCLPGERIYPLSMAGLAQVFQSGWSYYLYSLAGNLGFTLILFAVAKNFLSTRVTIQSSVISRQ